MKTSLLQDINSETGGFPALLHIYCVLKRRVALAIGKQKTCFLYARTLCESSKLIVAAPLIFIKKSEKNNARINDSGNSSTHRSDTSGNLSNLSKVIKLIYLEALDKSINNVW